MAEGQPQFDFSQISGKTRNALLEEERKKKKTKDPNAGTSKESEKSEESAELAKLLASLSSSQANPGATPMGRDPGVAQRMSALGAQGQAAIGQGAMRGAAMGNQIAPGGAGAAVGAGLGVLQGIGRRKQAKRAIKAEAVSEKGRIEKEKQDKVADVLGGIIANLRSAMIR